jgi:hypothetical protein
MVLTTEELAYIAGFFDGEGSITIHHNGKPSPRAVSPNHTLQVSIGNTDPQIIAWLHREFGGGFQVRKGGRDHHRPVAQWFLRAAKALPFLEAIQPFVRMKKRQVGVAIEFQRSKKMRGPRIVTAETVAWREEKRAIIRALNAETHIVFNSL